MLKEGRENVTLQNFIINKTLVQREFNFPGSPWVNYDVVLRETEKSRGTEWTIYFEQTGNCINGSIKCQWFRISRVIVFLGQINSSCWNLLYVSHNCGLKCAYIVRADNRANPDRLHLRVERKSQSFISPASQNTVKAQILVRFYSQADGDSFSRDQFGPVCAEWGPSFCPTF